METQAGESWDESAPLSPGGLLKFVHGGEYHAYNPDVVQGWSPELSGYEVRGDRAIRFRDASLG